MSQPHPDLARSTLAVLFIGGLIVGSFLIVQPFLPAIIWAMTLVIATWPMLLRIQRFLGNRRWLAVFAMTLLLLVVLILPFWLAIATVMSNLDEIAALARAVVSFRVPSPPDWLTHVPLIGARLTQSWQQFTATGIQDLAPRISPYVGNLTLWFASAVGSLGNMFVQLVLVVAIAAIMYAHGEQAAALVLRFGQRLGGERGEAAAYLAGQAIRGVALGVVGTALAQSLIGGIGLAIAGVPFSTALTALMVVLCLVQIGPWPVLIPAVIWMYYDGPAVSATILLVFTIVTLTMDNFLRPLLIRRGANLPLLLILTGVIGGLIAIGLLGIFVGPTVLAVAYTLLRAWMDEEKPAGTT